MADEKLEILITAKDAATGVFNKVGGALKGAFKVGLGLAVAGIGAMGAGLGYAIKEAMEAQTVTAQLEAVLKSTGGVAGVTAKAATDLADKWSGLTRFGDEAILTGENMLLTFTNIGKNIFPETTQTMLDMSAALGQDVTASAMQLGKALQDPVAGVTALQRVGVKFTDSQKAMIESLVKAGKTEEAQKMILKELQTEFGGSAEAAGKTFAGQLDILKNKLSNVAEGIGMALMPMLQGLASTLLDNVLPNIEKLGAALPKAFEFLKKGEIGNAFNYLVLTFQDLLGPEMTGALLGFGDTIQAVFTNAKPVIDGVINFFIASIPVVAGFLEGLRPTVENVFGAIINLGRTIIDAVVPFLLAVFGQLSAWFIANIPLITAVFTQFGDMISTVVNAYIIPAFQGFWGFIEPLLKALVDFILQIGTTIMQMATGDWSGAWQTMQDAAAKLWEAIKGAWAEFWPWFQGVVKGIATWFNGVDWAALGKSIIDGIWAGISGGWGWLKGMISQWVGSFWSWIKEQLGIRSPSSITAGYGLLLMQGLANGIMAGANLPQLALDGIGAKMTASLGGPGLIASVSSGRGGGGGTWNDNSYNEYNQNLTIVTNARSERLADDFMLMAAWRK